VETHKTRAAAKKGAWETELLARCTTQPSLGRTKGLFVCGTLVTRPGTRIFSPFAASGAMGKIKRTFAV
jgi:hypothetical protein